ncbi:hypothetical protein Klosneuvirus_3_312 [Klosneuvirus KNV1]|uniref:Uncharacterized protein n=1 Tax=Klosneuvirus KNV1 TaxID=1977640 RepID=A0A1V0SKC7_9VIRU|nr:hypothetical protein Klosneuvirus_3_312 [Klosneuvirus KNV1]
MDDSDSDYDNYRLFDFGSRYTDNYLPKCDRCHFRIDEPICRVKETNWGSQPIPIFDRSCMDGFEYENTIFCIACYGYLVGNSNIVPKLQKQNIKLENKLNQTEKEKTDALNKIKILEKEIEDMKFYSLEGLGYQQAKEHFEDLVGNKLK